MVSTDGTEYQTEICSFSICCARRTGKVVAPGGSRTMHPPAEMVAKTSKTDRSKCSGAGLQTRSDSVSPVAPAAHTTKVSALRCEIMTPFGVPVDPEVYRM